MGGKAAGAGISFQAHIGALIAASVLAEQRLVSYNIGLDEVPTKLFFESAEPIDDITVTFPDERRVFIQAKTSLTLSLKDAEFQKVASQFVRQYRNNLNSLSEYGSATKFVLAVTSRASDPIKSHLKSAVAKASETMESVFNREEQNALTIFRQILGNEWLRQINQQPSLEEINKLISLCKVYVWTEDVDVLVLSLLKPLTLFPDTEGGLLSALDKWALMCIATRGGGGVREIREFTKQLIPLKARPSFQLDISKLRTITDRTITALSKHSQIPGTSGSFRIKRNIFQCVRQAANDNHSFLLIGEPGSGKSGILHELSLALRSMKNLVVLQVAENIQNFRDFGTEYKLEHEITDVMDVMDGQTHGVLIIDALDATRGCKTSELAYRCLIEKVSNLQNWSVIASVRSFDLRMGKHFKTLFTGIPIDPTHLNNTYSNVKHVWIPSLVENEIEQIQQVDLALWQYITKSNPKLKALISNPFNLFILANLFCNQTDRTELKDFDCSDQLLDEYWLIFGPQDYPGSIALFNATQTMVANQSLQLTLKLGSENSSNALHQFCIDGMLTMAGTALQYRHHLLFDYAVYKLLLNDEELLYTYTRAGFGFIVAPAVSFFIVNLIKHAKYPTKFWNQIVELVVDPTTDPIVKTVIVLSIVQNLPDSFSTISLYSNYYGLNHEKYKSFLWLMIGSIGFMASKNMIFALRPWIELVSTFRQLDTALCDITFHLSKSCLTFNNYGDNLNSLGKSVRQIYDYCMQSVNERSHLIRQIIPLMLSTYETDVLGCRSRLKLLFESYRFKMYGFDEIPALCNGIYSIAQYDPDFAIEVYSFVFSSDPFDHKTNTEMLSSFVLPLSTSTRSAFEMASFSLSQEYSKILSNWPDLGATILIQTLNAESFRQHTHTPNESQNLVINKISFEIIEDYSFIWAANIQEREHDNFAKIYRYFFTWLSSNYQSANFCLLKLASVAKSAIAWRSIVEMGLLDSNSNLEVLWQLVTRPEFFCTRSLQDVAFKAITTFAPSVDKKRLKCFEDFICRDITSIKGLSREELSFLQFNALESIGSKRLRTLKAKKLLLQYQNFFAAESLQPASQPIRRPVTLSTHHSWLQREGVDTEVAKYRQILVQEEMLRANTEKGPSEQSSSMGDEVLTLYKLMEDQDDKDLPEPIRKLVYESLAIGIGSALKGKLPKNAELQLIRILQSILCQSFPASDAFIEQKYGLKLSWDRPNPRLSAIEQLLSNFEKVVQTDTWPSLLDDVKNLALYDSRAEIRYLIVRNLRIIQNINPPLMWVIIAESGRNEKNEAVLLSLLEVLYRLVGAGYSSEVETTYLAIGARFSSLKKEEYYNAILTQLCFIQNKPDSLASLRHVLGKIGTEQDHLKCLIFNLRKEVLSNANLPNEVYESIFSFFYDLLGQLISIIKTYKHVEQPTQEQQASYSVLQELAQQLYFSTRNKNTEISLMGDAARLRLFLKLKGIIPKILAYGADATIYTGLDLIQVFIDDDPEWCFDTISSAFLEKNESNRYLRDPIAGNDFIKMISRYLADYKYIFESKNRRMNLIKCVDCLISAGRIDAWELMSSIPGLII